MARVNAEECWWSDPRRTKLAFAVGSQALADGMALNAWRLAQEFWSRGKLIPWHTASALEGFEALLSTGLARLHETQDPTSSQVDPRSIQADPSQAQALFVYVRGSSEYHSWARDQRNGSSLGGQKSAQRPRDAKGRLVATSKVDPSRSKVVQASDSGSVSVSDSNTKTKDLKAPDGPQSEIGLFVGTYVKAYQNAYPPKDGGKPPRPDLSGKVQGQIKRYLQDVPIGRACELIQVYCQMEDSWFKTKCHDFGTFLENQNKVSLALDTGEDPSRPGSHIDWSKFT
jgi:hypothetical protein